MFLQPRIRNNIIWIAVIGTAIVLAPTLIIPLNGDNEIYQSMATDLFRFHRLPYTGSWDQNFPGIVYIHWLAIVLFGNTATGFRVFDLLIHLGVSAMLFILVQRWMTSGLALLSVSLYILFYFSNAIVIGGQRETFGVAFLVAGTLLLYRIKFTLSKPLGFAGGLVFGLMVVLRPTNILFAVCGFLFLGFVSRHLLLYFAIGLILPVVAVFAPYLFIMGGVREVYLTTIRYNLEIYGIKRMPWSQLLHQIVVLKFFLFPAVCGIILWWRHLRGDHKLERVKGFTRSELLLSGGYIVSAVFAMVAMGKYWMYSFEPIILWSAPFASISFQWIWDRMRFSALRYILCGALLLYVIYRVAPQSRMLFQHTLQGVSLGQVKPGFSERTDEEVAQYIERAPSNERFEVASIHAGLRWKCKRESTSRFTTFYSITETTPDGKHPDFQRSWQREFIDSLRTIRPYYIALSHTNPLDWPAPVVTIHTIPGFDSEVVPLYQRDTVLNGYTILRRR